MNRHNAFLLAFFVLAVGYHVSYSRFIALLRREQSIDLEPDVPMAKHIYTDFKALKFLLTRQYRNMGGRIQLWGNISLTCCLLGWVCMAVFIYFGN